MYEAAERRAVTIAAVTGLVLALGGGLSVDVAAADWRILLSLAGLVLLSVALVLAVLALWPKDAPSLPGKPELVFCAFVAFATGMILGAIATGATLVDFLGDDPFA